MNIFNLADFCGQHSFSGCEYVPTDKATIFRFCFDGKAYEAREDPDDGYRSYCGIISESDENVKREFPPVPVVCHMDEYHPDILITRDLYNGKVIFRIGTDYSDGYYPVCIFEYNPENMSINEPLEDGTC